MDPHSRTRLAIWNQVPIAGMPSRMSMQPPPTFSNPCRRNVNQSYTGRDCSGYARCIHPRWRLTGLPSPTDIQHPEAPRRDQPSSSTVRCGSVRYVVPCPRSTTTRRDAVSYAAASYPPENTIGGCHAGAARSGRVRAIFIAAGRLRPGELLENPSRLLRRLTVWTMWTMWTMWRDIQRDRKSVV